MHNQARYRKCIIPVSAFVHGLPFRKYCMCICICEVKKSWTKLLHNLKSDRVLLPFSFIYIYIILLDCEASVHRIKFGCWDVES